MWPLVRRTCCMRHRLPDHKVKEFGAVTANTNR
ncbi:hypothetical protein F9L08_26385 [Brucella tritici]|uniref:Ferric siderophore reductase C-terminal domain-containing protein n=1 Tax=Brucella tritici TaxID=94626 RepID=A0A6L3Y599_9HYPH|nr:hypothetical protein F9L08_26385 [Brucella tritici]